jgi:uncharacterized protein YbjT (DUF2867 family)
MTGDEHGAGHRATGKTGSALLDLLRARKEPVRAASRAPDAADAIWFEWDQIATHEPALDGVDRVYLVPPPSVVDPVPVVEPFLAEAQRRGIPRLVMLGSAIEFPHAPKRLELAARVRAQPGWLVLSPSGFMQNFLRPHPVGTAIGDHAEIATSAGSGRSPGSTLATLLRALQPPSPSHSWTNRSATTTCSPDHVA